MNISKRLTVCLHKGNLTVADLARWFERPDPTVRGWVKGGSVGGPSGDKKDIEQRLRKMETLLELKKRLPIPRMSQRDRAAYIEEMKVL